MDADAGGGVRMGVVHRPREVGGDAVATAAEEAPDAPQEGTDNDRGAGFVDEAGDGLGKSLAPQPQRGDGGAAEDTAVEDKARLQEPRPMEGIVAQEVEDITGEAAVFEDMALGLEEHVGSLGGEPASKEDHDGELQLEGGALEGGCDVVAAAQGPKALEADRRRHQGRHDGKEGPTADGDASGVKVGPHALLVPRQCADVIARSWWPRLAGAFAGLDGGWHEVPMSCGLVGNASGGTMTSELRRCPKGKGAPPASSVSWRRPLRFVALLMAFTSTMAATATSAAPAPLLLEAHTIPVPGTIFDISEGSDVVDGKQRVRLGISAVGKSGRTVTVVDPRTHTIVATRVASLTATAFAICGGDAVFVDTAGLVDAAGTTIIAAAPLFNLADPDALPAQALCPTPSERILPVPGGLQVAHLNGAGVVVDSRLLPFPHRARAYAGQGARSLRAERPYDSALSLYAPRLHAVDVDGDGDDDLVAHHEDRLLIFTRGADGLLSTKAIGRSLSALTSTTSSSSGGAELRLRMVPGNKRGSGAEALITIVQGALPEQTTLVRISSSSSGRTPSPLSTASSRQEVPGLGVLLGVKGHDAVIGRLDTSLVALSGVVLTGRVPVELRVGNTNLMSLPAKADVRAGRIDGAMPIVDVDVDGDGHTDLIHLGEPKAATLHLGSATTYAETSTTVPIPQFERAASLPASRVVALVGRRRGATSTVTLLGRWP